ncbi:UNVERIFIED_CONTAM: ABC-2 type transport system permease protein [Brevibacillus sp. OAP136]
MVYWLLLVKSFRRNLQYRMAHIINNFASTIFGFVFIAIWAGVLEGKGNTDSIYNPSSMAHYIAFTQIMLWITTFLSPGLGIHLQVRTGAVSLDLMRPVSYFLFVISQEAGKICYNLLYRTLPIAIVYSATVGFYFPREPFTYIVALLSILLAVYISLLLFFLVGLTSFWTNEISGLHNVLITLLFGLGGQFVPIDLFPHWLSTLALGLPFAGVLYYPTMLYLEQVSYGVLGLQAIWSIVLTIVCLVLTGRARRRTEIQGG